jgi:glycosyltransferase involved in cell wall biosynthesis
MTSNRNTYWDSQVDAKFAFIGAVVPHGEAYNYPALSIAGNLWQLRLLAALGECGLTCTSILSVRPVASFPRLRRLWFSSADRKLSEDLDAHYLAFANLGPVKALTLALSNFIGIVCWGWRHRTEKYKFVLTYNVSAPNGLSTLLGARIVHAKAFAVVADLPVPGHGIVPGTLARRVDFWLQTKSLPKFDGLIVLTEDIARDFAPATPFLRMEGAIDGPLMESLGDAPQLGTDRSFVLMYAGLLNAFDGIPLLLEAFSSLPGNNYRLIIVGKGPEQAKVEGEARRDPRILYKGYVTHEEVLELYSTADLLINPRPSGPLSARYVFPSKLIEYLASGRPVLTTATADVVEEYGRFAYVLRDETPQGLATAIEKVASLPEEERLGLGRAARQHMLKDKTWKVQGERVTGFIRKHLSSPF